MAKPVPRLTAEEIRRVVELAWNDSPPYHAVLMRHGLSPGQVVQLLKRELTPNAFKVWRGRTGADRAR
ncbi:MAG: TIGR03643 family protein [Rhizobacter sp.]|nr:TIGR03643 family protein [Rhizobacter sp.]